MAGLLEWSDEEFLKATIKMLRALMNKVENMQEQMSNINKEIKILRNNKNKC